jgi:hypothetical protein
MPTTAPTDGAEDRPIVRAVRARPMNADARGRAVCYVATLDTGGISHSGTEYVAVGITPTAARLAIFRAWRRNNPRGVDGRRIRTVEDLAEWFGIRVYGPLSDGQAVTTTTDEE